MPPLTTWTLSGAQHMTQPTMPSAAFVVHSERRSFYRLWYDLSEIGGYLSLFQSPHEDTEDTKESWKNLQHFLRPAERWPTLIRCSG